MTLALTARERDAIYDELVISLSNIDDVWRALEARDCDRLSRVALEQSDNLRILIYDLGWGDGSGSGVQLTTPPEVLRRTFQRIKETAIVRAADAQLETTEEAQHNADLVRMCAKVIDELRSSS